MSDSPYDLPGGSQASNIELDRVYSDETEESPFGSELVTPDDQQVHQGILERLDVAASVLGYFDSKELTGAVSIPSDAISGVIDLTAGAQQQDHGGMDDDMRKEGENNETSHSLLMALDFSSSDMSPILSSSSSDFLPSQLGMGSMYTLPNDHIVIEPRLRDSGVIPEKLIHQDEARSLIDSDSIPVFKRSDLGTKFWAKELGPTMSLFTCRALVYVAIRLICFLPWCLAVGGALLFSPEHLELLAFRTGYIGALNGIRRYAHWAEYGFQHIVAFLTFLVFITWLMPTFGILCIGGLMAQFCWTWHTFILDRNIPLGEDDMQTVYLLATSTWLKDTTVHIRKIGDSFYSTEKAKEDVREEGRDSD